jgi:hypothetical protein
MLSDADRDKPGLLIEVIGDPLRGRGGKLVACTG